MHGNIIGRLVAELRRRHRRNLSIRELRALDDRQLRDIGILRGDIPQVVDELMQTGTTTRRHESMPPIQAPAAAGAYGRRAA